MEGRESVSEEREPKTSNNDNLTNEENTASSQSKEEIVESFTEHNIDFFNSSLNIRKMTYDDYNYIIGTILFILLIFFIYIRYSN